MECYFDNSATTELLSKVVDEMVENTKIYYGNPSSVHRKGLEAERKTKKSREIVAQSLGAQPKEIIFTSGGTEANNLAIQGVAKAMKKRGKHIITSMVEHDSVYKTIKFLEEKEGFSVTYLMPDTDGVIELESIRKAIQEDTFFISLMHVNNELGSINDIAEIGKEIQKINKARRLPIHFHVDGVQSYLKLPLKVTNLPGVDSMSISAHKVHGPKGVGALFVRDERRMIPLIYGGGQETGYRSGTENTIGIWGFGKSVEIQQDNIIDCQTRLNRLKEYFLDNLIRQIKDIKINSPEKGAPHICNISFRGIPGEILLHSLESEGIFVSTGAACSSKKKGSRVLENLRLSSVDRESALRFSFSAMNTSEEIDYAVKVLSKKIPELRKILKYKIK